jgi:hypothetical protein
MTREIAPDGRTTLNDEDTMRRFSRWMPVKQDPPMTWVQRIVFGVLLVAVIPVYAALAVVLAPLLVRDRRRRARLWIERQGEGICTFARSFDRRRVDAWIIRAVHDAVQPYFEIREGPVPIRATDRLVKDIGIDPGDVDDIAETIAWRTGRPLRDVERNPVRQVDTVGDLVRFFAHQPRARAA